VEFEHKYADKPVHFLHVINGENPVQALDYQKHYRSDAIFLMDTTYEVSRSFDAGSWPTTVLVDAEGNIDWHYCGLIGKVGQGIDERMNRLMEKATGGPPKGSYCVGDTCYVRGESDAYEMAPTLIADGSGELHLVYVRDVAGVGELYYRAGEDGNWSEPERLTASPADDYAPALCADGKGGVWLVWCSDGAASGKYDVYAMHREGIEWSSPMQVTACEDDAAHPRAVVDSAGNLWVTYYRWIPWGQRLSRDREIFVRRYDGSAWSQEQQVSPTDLPRHEDHADPVVAADAKGNVWIAWTWDTHPENNWAYPATFGSALFARKLSADGGMSPLTMVAMRAHSVQAAMRDPSWAFLPEVIGHGGTPWFAFNAHSASDVEHACAVTHLEGDGGAPAPTMLGLNKKFVCSPRLLEAADGGLMAVWSAPAGRRYAVFAAAMKPDGEWGKERKVWTDDDADVRFASAAFAGQGNLWIAAVKITQGKSEVATKSVSLP
jgi:hypothetical protein